MTKQSNFCETVNAMKVIQLDNYIHKFQFCSFGIDIVCFKFEISAVTRNMGVLTPAADVTGGAHTGSLCKLDSAASAFPRIEHLPPLTANSVWFLKK